MSKDKAQRIQRLAVTLGVIGVVMAVVANGSVGDQFIGFFAGGISIFCTAIAIIFLVVSVVEERS